MWDYSLIEEAQNDFQKLDGSQKKIVVKMLEKLRENPLPQSQGGYGIPLGNHANTGNLSGLFKLKARGFGIRVVYSLLEIENCSVVIVIAMRKDMEVYKTAVKRKNR